MVVTPTCVETLVQEIKKINPLQSASLDDSLQKLDDEELAFLGDYFLFCLDCGVSMNYLAECYDLTSKDILREQIYFRRKKRYRYSTYDEVAASVYLDGSYMEKYMYGLAVSYFLWPNHLVMRRFFLQSIPKDVKGSYLEIGPGHGFYFISAIKTTSYDRFDGVDISPTSAEMTRRIISGCCPDASGSSRILCQDFLAAKDLPVPYDAVVMGEVLEHVEKPQRFLQKITDVSNASSFIYITTAINAPAIDHIYLFDSVESVETMVENAGLKIKDSLVVPYAGLSLEQSLEQKLPVNVAMVLGK